MLRIYLRCFIHPVYANSSTNLNKFDQGLPTSLINTQVYLFHLLTIQTVPLLSLQYSGVWAASFQISHYEVRQTGGRRVRTRPVPSRRTSRQHASRVDRAIITPHPR